jgi:hypothetical protein
MNALLVSIAQAEPVAGAAAELLKNGVLGAAVVALTAALVVLWRDNGRLHRERLDTIERLQAQRVLDAQAFSAQLLKTNAECVAALTNVTTSMEATRDAMTELKAAYRELADEVRARPSRR